MNESVYKCPECGKVFGLDVFNCPVCEVILNHSLVEKIPEAPREPTLIRRMLAPDGSLERPEPTAPGVPIDGKSAEATSPTVVMPYPEPRDGIPTLIIGIDLTEIDVTVFEAFVLSRIDGSSTVEQLRKSLDMSKLEVNVVLKTLKEKKVIRVEEKDERPVPVPAKKKITETAKPASPTPASVISQSTASGPTPQIRPAPRPKTRSPRILGAHGTERSSGRSGAVSPVVSGQPPKKTQANNTAEADPADNPLQQAIRLEKKGDFEGAITVLEKAIAGSPNPAALYNRLAIVLIKERRDFFRAEELLNKATKLAPNSQTISNNLAKVLMMIASNTGMAQAPADRSKW